MAKFFVAVSRNMQSTIEHMNDLSVSCKSEFLYNLKLLTACFGVDGKALLDYQDDIVQLMGQIVRIDFEQDLAKEISHNLACLYNSLTQVYLYDCQFEHPRGYSESDFVKATVNFYDSFGHIHCLFVS